MTTLEAPVVCSICCEAKIPVAMCGHCNQNDKHICEKCAVKMHNGCSDVTCDCFGFTCPYCRRSVKTPMPWQKTSALYWEARALMLASKLERLADYRMLAQQQYAASEQEEEIVPVGYHNF